MKFRILKNKLKDGLNIVERIPIKSLTLPILNNVLIKTEKNFLRLSTTDLEVAINWWSLAKIEEEGSVVIPVKILFSFINLLQEKPIELKNEGQDLIIELENYHTKLKGFNPDEFPIIPKIEKGEFISIEASKFCRSLSQVVEIPILSSARPEISGILLLFQKDLIKIVATDSFRLGEKKIFFKKPLNLSKKYSFILPQKTAKEIINVFSEQKGKLKIYFSPNQILFESQMEETDHPRIQLISKLIEGEYPDYRAIFPKESETRIILRREEFLNKLRAASIFASKMNEIRLKTDPTKKEMRVLSQNPELGEYRSSFPSKITGKGSEVSFNWRFLIDGLSNIKSQEIIFEINGEDGPAVLKPINDDSYVYLVMPVKTS